MSTLKFTQEIKDKWLARLRDPNSKQLRNSWSDADYHTSLEGIPSNADVPMCCLAHGQYAIFGNQITRANKSIYELVDACDINMVEHLIAMNDRHNKSLTEIADYIEANIPAVKE